MDFSKRVNIGIVSALMGLSFGLWSWYFGGSVIAFSILAFAIGGSWFALSSVMYNSLRYFGIRVVLVPFVLTQALLMASVEVVVFHFAKPANLPLISPYGLMVMLIGGFFFLVLSLQGMLIYILKMQENNQRDQERISLQRQLAHEAGIQELQYKFQPHFLYNSLNTINALVGIDPKRARNMIVNLSDLLRRSVIQTEAPLHALEEELKVLRQYLEIEQERFGERLIVEMDVAPEANQLPIPPFLLQPVLENAIKYGLYGSVGDVRIRLEVLVQPLPTRMAIISVLNPYPVDELTTRPDGTRSGLRILARRLGLVYGRSDLLVAGRQGEQFVTTIRVPF